MSNNEKNKITKVPVGRPKTIDELKAVELRLKGLTYKEIAKQFNVTEGAVSQCLHKLQGNIDIYAKLKDGKDKVFEWLQARIINSIDDAEIKKAHVRDKITCAGILEDKIRVIRGQATQNVSVLVAHIKELQARKRQELLDE